MVRYPSAVRTSARRSIRDFSLCQPWRRRIVARGGRAAAASRGGGSSAQSDRLAAGGPTSTRSARGFDPGGLRAGSGSSPSMAVTPWFGARTAILPIHAEQPIGGSARTPHATRSPRRRISCLRSRVSDEKMRSVAREERAFRGGLLFTTPQKIMPLLIITCDESNLSRQCLIEVDRFTIGRSRDSSVSIPHRSVSKTHLELEKTPAGYSFRDLESKNGTFLNEERRQNGVLRDGDVIRVGKVRITFKEPPAAKPPAAPVCSPRPSIPAPPPAIAAPPAASGPAMPGGEAFARPRAGGRWRRALISLGIGVLGIGLGLLAGQVGSLLGPDAPGARRGETSGPAGGPAISPEGIRTDAAAPAPGPVAASSSRAEGTSAAEASPAEAVPEAKPMIEDSAAPAPIPPVGPGGGAARIAASWYSDLERPYSDPGESSRVLFRLFLDVLGRPPTRGEAVDPLPLGHAGGWSRLREYQPAPSGDKGSRALFKTFLGREPSIIEEVALRAVERGDSFPPGKGIQPDPRLLLTASNEYRSADRRRPRSSAQRARSLIVDLLDRPPESEDEVREVEKALAEDPGAAAARVLAFSEQATAALPELPLDGTGGADSARRAWIAEECRRFLGRTPADAGVRALLAEF